MYGLVLLWKNDILPQDDEDEGVKRIWRAAKERFEGVSGTQPQEV